VTKKEIIKRLAEEWNLSQTDTKNIVQGTFDTIIKVITESGRIELRNFGVFEVKERAARKARNPRTSQPVEVPAKRVVTFKPGRLMQRAINGDEETP
jgi:nucleoid DNA-binding protein